MSLKSNIKASHKERFIERLATLLLEFGIDTQMDSAPLFLARYLWRYLVFLQKIDHDILVHELKTKLKNDKDKSDTN